MNWVFDNMRKSLKVLWTLADNPCEEKLFYNDHVIFIVKLVTKM